MYFSNLRIQFARGIPVTSDMEVALIPALLVLNEAALFVV
jgi:hypothetical protein